MVGKPRGRMLTIGIDKISWFTCCDEQDILSDAMLSCNLEMCVLSPVGYGVQGRCGLHSALRNQTAIK